MTSPRAAIRDAQTELTRSRILQAVVRIVATNVADLSVEAVAREAGVSRPTVYRYFASKRDMVDAVSRLYAERLRTDAAMSSETLDDILAEVPAVFGRWERLEPELRAAAASAHGEEARARYLPARLATTRRILEPYTRELSSEDRDRLERLAVVFLSSGMADVLQRYLGASADEASDLVVWGVRRLVGEGSKR